MEFRSLNIDDYDRLMALWQRAGLNTRPKGRDSRESITNEMISNPDGFIGLFDADKLIGFSLASSISCRSVNSSARSAGAK